MIRLDGLTQAKKTLEALPDAFKEVAVETIDEGTDIMLNEAYGRVPVGSGRDPHPGELQRSLGKNTRDDGLEAAVGSGLYRAKFTEFGTNDTPAEPFLFPAFRIGAKYIRRLMREWAQQARDIAIEGNVNAGRTSIGSVGGVSFRTKQKKRAKKAAA